jgi:hypothetical protein
MTALLRPQHRIVIAGLAFFEKYHNMSYPALEVRIQFLAEIPQRFAQKEKLCPTRWHFLTPYSVEKVPDPLGLVQTIMDQLSQMTVQPMPKMILQMAKVRLVNWD